MECALMGQAECTDPCTRCLMPLACTTARAAALVSMTFVTASRSGLSCVGTSITTMSKRTCQSLRCTWDTYRLHLPPTTCGGCRLCWRTPVGDSSAASDTWSRQVRHESHTRHGSREKHRAFLRGLPAGPTRDESTHNPRLSRCFGPAVAACSLRCAPPGGTAATSAP